MCWAISIQISQFVVDFIIITQHFWEITSQRKYNDPCSFWWVIILFTVTFWLLLWLLVLFLFVFIASTIHWQLSIAVLFIRSCIWRRQLKVQRSIFHWRLQYHFICIRCNLRFTIMPSLKTSLRLPEHILLKVGNRWKLPINYGYSKQVISKFSEFVDVI